MNDLDYQVEKWLSLAERFVGQKCYYCGYKFTDAREIVGTASWIAPPDKDDFVVAHTKCQDADAVGVGVGDGMLSEGFCPCGAPLDDDGRCVATGLPYRYMKSR